MMSSEQKQPTPQSSTLSAIRRSGLGVGVFAVFTSALIAITQAETRDKIRENIREAESRALFEIFPETIDPQIYNHQIRLDSDALNVDVDAAGYQAIRDQQVQGVILPVRTSAGYSGDIDLIVGIERSGAIAGVRVINHRETPGLGDNVELGKSPWILSFNGKIREGSDDPRWAVRKDGGQFDQFTGATITPRAVVGATAVALDYFAANKEMLLSLPANPTQPQQNSEPEHEQ